MQRRSTVHSGGCRIEAEVEHEMRGLEGAVEDRLGEVDVLRAGERREERGVGGHQRSRAAGVGG